MVIRLGPIRRLVVGRRDDVVVEQWNSERSGTVEVRDSVEPVLQLKFVELMEFREPVVKKKKLSHADARGSADRYLDDLVCALVTLCPAFRKVLLHSYLWDL